MDAAPPLSPHADGPKSVISCHTILPQPNQDWERLYLLQKARWLVKEAPVVEAMADKGTMPIEETPACIQRRLRKKASRTPTLFLQRRDGEYLALVSAQRDRRGPSAKGIRGMVATS